MLLKKYFLNLISIFILSILMPVYAQEIQILDESGKPIVQNENVEYVPNEIIVNFSPKTIILPQGRIAAEFREAAIHSQVTSLVRAEGVRDIRKVFRFFTAADTIRTLKSGQKRRVPDLSQFFVLSFHSDKNIPAMLNRFRRSPRVIHAQPNYIYHLGSNPNDPKFSDQWGFEQSTGEDIDATTAWNYQTGSYSIKIGIYDTGIDYNHKDLGNAFGIGWKVVGGWDWVNNDSNPIDDNGHGSHVAGIAGALTHNTHNGNYVGVAGVAGGWGYNRSTNSGNKGVQLFAMKIANSAGSITSSDASDAIVEGADPDGDGWGYGIHVQNHSHWGGSYDETMRGAINYAARMNSVFVAIKGNAGTNNPNYPSDYDRSWVISVGATDQSGNRWSNSSFGNGIDVVAPGIGILSTIPGNGYGYKGGTSQAAPHVSGLAALILSQNPTLHIEDVQGIIRASAKDKGDPGYDDEYGAGRINAGRALEYMQAPWTLNRFTASYGTSVSNTGTYTISFFNTGGGLSTGQYYVKRYDVRKTVSLGQFQNTPYVWGRGTNASTGWSAANPNYQSGYCNVVSSTSTSAVLQSYVYKVWNTSNGHYRGWYPTTPSNVTFAYTVVGIPEEPTPQPPPPPTGLTISGNIGQSPTLNWNASSGATSYKVYRRVSFNPAWILMGTASSTSYTDNTLEILNPNDPEAESFYYHVTAVNSLGESGPSNEVFIWGFSFFAKASHDNTSSIPTEFGLSENYPNPFNPETNISYQLPEESFVTLVVYNISGQKVRTLVNQHQGIGYYTVKWDGRNAQDNVVPSGVYLYEIRAVGAPAGDFRDVKRMLLLK